MVLEFLMGFISGVVHCNWNCKRYPREMHRRFTNLAYTIRASTWIPRGVGADRNRVSKNFFFPSRSSRKSSARTKSGNALESFHYFILYVQPKCIEFFKSFVTLRKIGANVKHTSYHCPYKTHCWSDASHVGKRYSTWEHSFATGHVAYATRR